MYLETKRVMAPDSRASLMTLLLQKVHICCRLVPEAAVCAGQCEKEKQKPMVTSWRQLRAGALLSGDTLLPVYPCLCNLGARQVGQKQCQHPVLVL